MTHQQDGISPNSQSHVSSTTSRHNELHRHKQHFTMADNKPPQTMVIAQPTSPGSFFSFPAEIRLKIYEAIFWTPRITTVEGSKDYRCPCRRFAFEFISDIFQPQNVCQEFRHELLKLYSTFSFKDFHDLHSGVYKFEKGTHDMVLYVNPIIDTFQALKGCVGLHLLP